MKSSSAKSRAEMALAVFELREENSRLQDENTRLHSEASLVGMNGPFGYGWYGIF